MTWQVSSAQFTQIMRQGELAYASGDRARAHRIWRRAAMLRPGEERVWLALLNVVETDEDRTVCLQNVLTINPQNVRARRQLDAVLPPSPIVAPVEPPAHMPPAPSLVRLRQALSLLLVVVVGVLLGVVLQIVIAADLLHL